MVPQWPIRALDAIVTLFRELQDIDVYVEDAGSEALYSELVKRIAPPPLRVTRVFALGGREAVLRRAAGHDHHQRPALFLVDGDFAWVRGEPAPRQPGVYRLDAYCVENLLVSEEAVSQVFMECEACTEQEARVRLSFRWWVEQASVLVDLFVVWAALNAIDPTIRTTATGLGQCLNGRAGEIDAAKVACLRASAAQIVAARAGSETAILRVEARVRLLAFPLDAVSGKDFVLPALHMHLNRRTRERPSRKSLMFRLARHACATRFAGLASALHRAARGEVVHS